MIFTGDWNGGERGFRLATDHRLELQNIEREDAGTDSRVSMSENDELTRIDDYAWADSTTLRWRSRLATDPPFENAERVYILDYTLENVLIPTEQVAFFSITTSPFPTDPAPSPPSRSTSAGTSRGAL